MTRFSTRTKIIALAVLGLTLASVPAAAGGYHHYYHGGYGYNGGAVAAGVVGGLILGGIAASAAQPVYAPECWIERQTVYNRYGEPYYRDVQVCR